MSFYGLIKLEHNIHNTYKDYGSYDSISHALCGIAVSKQFCK